MRADIVLLFPFLYPWIMILALVAALLLALGSPFARWSVRAGFQRRWMAGTVYGVVALSVLLPGVWFLLGTIDLVGRVTKWTDLGEQVELASRYDVDLRSHHDPSRYPAADLARQVYSGRSHASEVWDVMRDARARQRCTPAPYYLAGTSYSEEFVFFSSDFDNGQRAWVVYDDENRARYAGALVGPPDNSTVPSAKPRCQPF
jgi:hypothetical protein